MRKLMEKYKSYVENKYSSIEKNSEAWYYLKTLSLFSEKIYELGYVEFTFSMFSYGRRSSNTCYENIDGSIKIQYQNNRDGKYDSNDIKLDKTYTRINDIGICSQYIKEIESVINALNEYCDSLEKVEYILINNELINLCELEGVLIRNNVPKDCDVIRYPEMRRGELCTSFIPISNWQKLSDVKKNSIILMKSNKKNSKGKEYIVIDVNHEKTIAVKEKGANSILFLQDKSIIDNAYDNLFLCNKKEVSGWWNKTREVIDVVEEAKL